MDQSRRYERVLIVSLLLLFTACQSAPERVDEKQTEPLIPNEFSLKEDRSQFDELRKEIPDEIRRENDELAFVRSLMADGDTEPGKIRDRYYKAVRDRREKFNKAQRKLREEFSKRERSARESFLKSLKAEREQFMKRVKARKASHQERKDFFDEIEARRRDFFNDQRDNRNDFEARATEQRRAFDAYINERNQIFNQELREYTALYNERRKAFEVKKKAERAAREKAIREGRDPIEAQKAVSKPAKASQANDPDLEDFKSIPPGPGSPLGPDQNE